jgi:transposase
MNAHEKRKALELLESSRLPKRLALECLDIPSSSYYNWLRKLNDRGTLENCVRVPEYRCLTDREDVKKQVFKVLHSPPSNFGFNRTSWKFEELQDALRQSGLKIGMHSIRRIIREAGYRWLKAKKVLTSNDPDYRERLNKIHQILGSLSDKDGFFSIDEYGPFAVKQRQGKKLVPPRASFTVPQFQKSKGALIMTAALELSTNQVTHFYSKKKDTEEMIKLVDILLEKYSHLDRIYLSWDAASWHISKKLKQRIVDANSEATSLGHGKLFLAPLPAGAQFLNVIEAVFSGMSRAIIHNSDYGSKDEAKAAIDRYFRERNEFFLKHPKRAGNKIWGKEKADIVFSEGKNCKDPCYR